MKKNKNKIPFGMYCYKDIKKTKSGYKRIGICPYWSIRKDKPEQENGYCAYLERGDWDLNQEYEKQGRWRDGKTGRFVKSFKNMSLSHLWDMVKECGINKETEKIIEK